VSAFKLGFDKKCQAEAQLPDITRLRLVWNEIQRLVLPSLEKFTMLEIQQTDAIKSPARPLKEVLDEASVSKERLTLVYNNQLFLAVVPIEDVRVIEQLEDCIDNANADDALKEGGDLIPLEQLEKELGL